MAQRNSQLDLAARVASLVKPASKGRRRLGRVLRFIRQQPLGSISVVVITGLVLVALLANFIVPYDPYAVRLGPTRAAPTESFIMGTDNLGRDYLSRIVFGARVSLVIGLTATLLATAAGTVIGLLSGFFKGKLDMILQRIVDTLMAFPGLVLAMVLVALLGQSLLNVIIALAVGIAPPASRVVRGAVLSVSQHPYVEGARAIGCSSLRIMFFHILPNVFAPILVIASVLIGGTVIAEASLSFLGLGPPPPTPSWGRMITEGRLYFSEAPHLVFFPAAAIVTLVLSVNLFGDAMRDTLDPKLRGR